MSSLQLYKITVSLPVITGGIIIQNNANISKKVRVYIKTFDVAASMHCAHTTNSKMNDSFIQGLLCFSSSHRRRQLNTHKR